ncbi:MAG: zinc-binding alcohol dehydrogenase [Clostridiales bacterium]|nr:zinc-binding alcohol dehydrogenase [Clostridiales bacterium]
METWRNKKIIFAAKQDARLVEEEWDPRPAEGEITGRMLFSVISSGSETGGYMDYFGGASYPCPTGYAGVLEVLEAGGGARGLKKGDVVFAQARHQLFARIDAALAVPVPVGMPTQLAVMARFPAVSMTTLVKTAVKPTEPVIVTGLGVIGLMCAQVMKRCGYPVYAVDPSPSRRAMASACGIANTAAAMDEFGFLKGNAGLGIDCSGSDDAVLSLIRMVRKGGEVSLVGVPWRATSGVVVNELFRAVFNGYVTVYSGWEWSLPLHSGSFAPNSSFNNFAVAMEWIRRGEIAAEGIYALRPPEECADVYRSLSEGWDEKVCVMFDWRNCS